MIEAPTEPGWYGYPDGKQKIIFLLTNETVDGSPKWFVFSDSGSSSECHWGYIEQGLGIWDLVRLIPEKTTSVANPNRIGEGLRIGG